jgi:hypothetical protein
MVGLRCIGNYEYWVSDAHGRPGSIEENNFISNYLANGVGFDSSILQQPTNDSAAPVPVARLIDTDTYTGAGSGPNVTLSPAIGIGEFANANFFSEDTIYGPYPHPNVNTLVPSQVMSPPTGTIFKYYAKGTGDGIPNDFAAAECVLDQAAKDQGIFSGPIYLCLDEVVWSSTAQACFRVQSDTPGARWTIFSAAKLTQIHPHLASIFGRSGTSGQTRFAWTVYPWALTMETNKAVRVPCD